MENKEWYVLHTYSGYENKVRENIELRKESMNMEENIFRIVIPEEEIIEVVDGVEKKKVAKTFPGYVLIEMVMSDEAWFIVRNTPGVTGFVGSHGAGSKPSPLLPDEMATILGDVESPKARVELNLAVGDLVEIIEGAFSGLSGTVDAVNADEQTLSVILEMFGRETEAELEFSQVKKQEV
ncbi:transcription termination/antitermination protein NusG [Tuanshanicoccus lijuaniae]|uniref:transcription termination/antitermination protein NusG n=1 Tax=Aerococcaceae bacterium zg-1292 TaxID=2774330 RepID=UPI00193562A5|nr:transcription termination/antitermination protein NusG [Aerococcaceae bacterium zg-1292]MBF6625380.1 transcription termination/antitermination protein NusG [Aerococcaceae bacterium zg-BR9]MBF6979041.1 transcription termination/antitermination protein NusG [Aerococcaceae bacterium zg-BR22]MBS4456388.1 transcription termination/antitermination protein NusG [Aerococcaceae bacterium zg-A91]MBS4458196.1 transcription termination/antitermination protein NusG [Aerococcaceae bacterium zg-BR33]